MVIAQINVIYGHGSTGKIVQALHEEYLRLGQDSYVFYGRGGKNLGKNVIRTGYLWEAKLWRFIQMFTGNMLGGSPLSTRNLKRHIKKLNPDVVHVQLINGNMCNVFSLFKWLKKNNYNTVLTHHAKLMFTGGCGINLCDKHRTGCGNCPYKKEVFGFAPDRSKHIIKKLSGLEMDGNWIKHTYVSPWLMSLAKETKLLGKADNHAVVNPVDIEIFNPDSKMHAPHEKPYVFFPASVHAELKGWKWIDEVGKRLQEQGLDLLVTGSGSETFATPNVKDIGHISDQNLLAEYYRHAKLTLVLSQFESFSMPVAESLCCGAPVCGFKAGGPESIGIEGACVFVEQGDIDGLIDAVKAMKEKRIDAEAAKNKYGREAVAKELLTLYR